MSTMPKNESNHLIRKCLDLIEKELGWGASSDWNNYDFSKLSDEVHNRTHIRLSVTTLKRIWGRVKYDSAPTLTTLNTLARFAGFDDWRGFCRNEGDLDREYPSGQPTLAQSVIMKHKVVRYLMVALSMVAGCLLILSLQKPGVDANKFQFRADKMVTEGVPNSVIFDYDASAAETDSVFIVQTWDINRKKIVSRDNHKHSAIYYYPGFFRTKLIVGSQIVKTHDLWITSDGWLGLVEQEPIPIYFEKQEYIFEDRVEIDESLLKKYNLNLHPAPPKIRFFNQRDLGNITSDNFVFETSLKHQFEDGMGACQFVQVLIQCKDDVIIIPLGAKACVGDMFLYFCGTYIKSEDADLSQFGCDLNDWSTLRVESKNKDVNIFVNGTKAYSLTFPNDATGVVGVQYRFNGVGAVMDTWFETEDGVIRL